MGFVHYRAVFVTKHATLPGIRNFSAYFKLYGYGVMPIDRTGTIRFPVRTTSLFPLPKMREFTSTYEEICNERAQELLKRAEKLDVPLYAFWSGGVDSTCLLVSLLKNATPSQKERIVVLLSEESIREYSAFYFKHIRGKLRCDSAMLFPYLFGGRSLIVNGEHNDQLFGSDIIGDAINRFCFETVAKPYDRTVFTTFFTEQMEGDEEKALLYVNLFERLKEVAPIPLKTNYDLFWWINFATKWQNVYSRMLSFTAKRNMGKISQRYVQDYYAPFFNTDDFQLWSMNNRDQRVKDCWRSYKWPSKELIYDFTKDADYRDNKIKRGSLQFLVLQHAQADFIDDSFMFRANVTPAEFYEEENDFI